MKLEELRKRLRKPILSKNGRKAPKRAKLVAQGQPQPPMRGSALLDWFTKPLVSRCVSCGKSFTLKPNSGTPPKCDVCQLILDPFPEAEARAEPPPRTFIGVDLGFGPDSTVLASKGAELERSGPCIVCGTPKYMLRHRVHGLAVTDEWCPKCSEDSQVEHR